MRVTNITVSYLRELQPAKYEKAVPAVEFSVSVDEGEDHKELSRNLMHDAIVLAHDALGVDVPNSISNKVAVIENSVVQTEDPDVQTENVAQATGTVAQATGTAVKENPFAEKDSEVPSATAEKPKRTRRTKAEMEAARLAEMEQERAEAKADDNEIPGATPNISTGEERINPEDSEIPDYETASQPESNLTSDSVKQHAIKLCNDKGNSFDTKKYIAILHDEFKVARTEDVPVNKLQHLMDLVDDAASGASSSEIP
jgi:hypothetical protein